MTYAPTKPLDIPPYQVQPLIESVIESYGYNTSEGISTVDVKCAQALGSEIYVGCSNGELLRFALEANTPDQILITSTDRQIHFYTLPSLDPVPSNVIKPIRNVVTFAVDQQHILRPAPPLTDPPIQADPIEFCVIKRSSIMLYSLQERLFFEKDIPLPNGAFFAKRSGRRLCIADREFYSMVDLDAPSQTPLMPISQAPPDLGGPRIRPVIVVVAENEFLILSWNGASTMGLFINGDCDPVRGTLEWPSHPIAVCLDYPYITTLLPNQTIEIHNVETQTIAQVIAAPPLPSPSASPSEFLAQERRTITVSLNGFLVPSQEQSEKLRLKKVKFMQGRTKFVGREEKKDAAQVDQDVERLEGDAEHGQELEIPPFET
ncbi:hypothetical protein EW146_g10492 [Bondarzewia mesenterica]|uniref:CNH domain-containing protein n=1 Tax=Bondarzewia mesenterica TaxID=1095465 RepID=A0A4S4KXQ4_9AGAM|nr:hypothetical protein EW146_g10492 [Bondarzewia mesenterica]